MCTCENFNKELRHADGMYDELVQIIIHDRFTFANKFAQMRITQR